MTRKDYELIARSINRQWQHHWQRPVTMVRQEALETLDTMIAGLAIDLEATNPRFDADRFTDACKAK